MNISGLNLAFWDKKPKTRVQEEALVFSGKIRPPAEFNEFTYKQWRAVNAKGR
jgi:hypothetical protein